MSWKLMLNERLQQDIIKLQGDLEAAKNAKEAAQQAYQQAIAQSNAQAELKLTLASKAKELEALTKTHRITKGHYKTLQLKNRALGQACNKAEGDLERQQDIHNQLSEKYKTPQGKLSASGIKIANIKLELDDYKTSTKVDLSQFADKVENSMTRSTH